MTGTSRFLLHVARWIAGSERAEWIDAMASEAGLAGRQSTAWALGCLRTAIGDRIWRERHCLIAVSALPAAAFLLEAATFFPSVWVMRRAGLPGWTLLLPTVVIFLALGFVLGRQVSRRRALVLAAASSLLFLAIGWTIFWIKFGQSPAIWFDKGSTIYMMPPLLGIASGASIWMLGAWLGSRSRGSATPPPIKG